MIHVLLATVILSLAGNLAFWFKSESWARERIEFSSKIQAHENVIVGLNRQRAIDQRRIDEYKKAVDRANKQTGIAYEALKEFDSQYCFRLDDPIPDSLRNAIFPRRND